MNSKQKLSIKIAQLFYADASGNTINYITDQSNQSILLRKKNTSYIFKPSWAVFCKYLNIYKRFYSEILE